jgi:hypothetical protein
MPMVPILVGIFVPTGGQSIEGIEKLAAEEETNYIWISFTN